MTNLFVRYKWHFFSCWLFLCMCVPAVAQTSKIDDLLAQLKPNDPDTVQIRILRRLSAAYTSVDPDKKFYYAKKYLQLAEKHKIDSTIADAYLDFGISYAVKSNLDSGLYYFRLGKDKAKAINYLNGMARGYVNIGFVLDRKDQKQESVKNYEESLKIYRKLNHKRGINQCIMNLGSIYFDIGEYKTADIYFRQVLESVKETPNDRAGLANALFSLGGSNRKLGHPKIALDYYKKSLAIREELGDLNGIALSNWGIGLILNSLGKHEQSLTPLKIALQNNRNTKNLYQEAIVLMALSDVYLHLKDYDKAKTNAKLALKRAKDSNSKGLVVQALEYLVKVETAQKNYAEAFKLQSNYIAINDSLKNTEIKKEVILDDLHRVNTDNQNLEKRNETITAKIKDYSIAISIITALLVLVIILLVLYYKRNSEKKTANALLQIQKQEIAEVNEELSSLNEELKTQMEIVFAQNIELEKLNKVKNKFFSIVSHDLRAPINSLKALFGMYRNGDLSDEELGNLLHRLEETIYSTASFLDNLLEWSKGQLQGMVTNPVEVNLSEIIAHNITLTETQAKLKSIEIKNNVDCNMNVFADLNMVHVVFRNLLSNAIKFCKTGDEVTFDARYEVNNIVCSIKDTGPGISDIDKANLFNLAHTPNTGTAGEKGYHIGLILCKDMIVRNNGSLHVESKLGEGTTFFITLPLMFKDKLS